MNQGNTFGHLFRITTWGESHGGGVGVVIDGCPSRLKISSEDIQKELDRRRPGQSSITTQRNEKDQAEILSGVFEGKTLGTPISIWVKNKDARSKDYLEMKESFRPSHADFTYEKKYGIRNWQGGGRASARETIGRVAGASIAKKILEKEKIKVLAYVKRVGNIETNLSLGKITLAKIETNAVRCPDSKAAKEMIELIEQVRKEGDSLGGVIEAVAFGVPVGLGEPVFSKLEADLAGALMSLPASKGFEVGSGFSGTYLRGSEHNDPFIQKKGKIGTLTNHSGGIQGGISNGEPIIVRIAFKPTSTIAKDQSTVTRSGKKASLKAKGRHDPCVLPRAVPMVEAMINLVLVDHLLMHRATQMV